MRQRSSDAVLVDRRREFLDRTAIERVAAATAVRPRVESESGLIKGLPRRRRVHDDEQGAAVREDGSEGVWHER